MTPEKFKTVAVVGLALVAAVLVAPFVMAMIGGIVGVAVALGLLLVLLALVPAASSALTALKFKAVETVVSYAPVQALIAQAEAFYKELEEIAKALHAQATDLELMHMQTKQVNKNYPEDAEANNAELESYEKLFAYRTEKFKESKAAYSQFLRAVEKAKVYYDRAVIDARLNKAFKGKAKDFMAEFKVKTAFEAVDRKRAESLANLRMANMESTVSPDAPQDIAKKITYDQSGKLVLGHIFDVEAVTVPREPDANQE